MTSEMEDLVALALEATGMSRGRWDFLMEEMKSDAKMNLIMREDWGKKPRDSEEAIREYYRTSDIWFVNTFLNGVGALRNLGLGVQGGSHGWLEMFMKLIGPRKRSILDYGGGFFKDTWPLVSFGHHVEVAEVQGPVTSFLKMFIEMAGLEGKIGVVEVNSDTPVIDLYDGIVCFETLEHVLHPEALTEHLHRHLRAGGPFAFSTTFGAPEHAPYHVASNAPLGDWNVWAEILKRVGFSPCWTDPAGSSAKIWRSEG